jgi:hypothetical protein
VTEPSLTLEILRGSFAVARLPGDADLPAWAAEGAFASVTRTPDEVSVICEDAALPAGSRAERGFRCLRVAGSIPFSAVGVLESLTRPLADAGISVMAVSTYDTDYLLVRAGDLAAARDALLAAGFDFAAGPDAGDDAGP